MQVNISGHHVTVTDAIRMAVADRFEKIRNHYPSITVLDAILTVERTEQKIEVKTNYLGATVSVHAGNDDLYVAIGQAAKKLESALSHRKGAMGSKRNEKIQLQEEIEVEEPEEELLEA